MNFVAAVELTAAMERYRMTKVAAQEQNSKAVESPPAGKPFEVKFIHLRNHEAEISEGVAGPTSEITAWGGVTIGYIEVPCEDDKDKKEILYTFAKCCVSDNFNKKIGRNICIGRLKKNKDVQVIKIPASLHRTEIVRKLADEYYHEEQPHWHNIRNYVF